MILEKDRRNLFILDIISMVLCLAVIVPYGINKVTLFEILFKYVGIAIVMLVITLHAISLKYRSYKPSLKYSIASTYCPLFAYMIAVLISGLFLMIRLPNAFSHDKLVCYILLFALVSLLAIAFAYFYIKRVPVFSKNEAMLIDAFLIIVTIIFTICIAVLAGSLRGQTYRTNAFIIIIPIIFGIFAGVLHGFTLKYLLETNEEVKYHKTSDLYSTWLDQAENLYGVARDEILWELFDFVNGELGFELVEEEDLDEAKPEPEPVEPEPVKEEVVQPEPIIKEVETIKEVRVIEGVSDETVQKLLDRIAQLESEVKKSKHIIESRKESIIATISENVENEADRTLNSKMETLTKARNSRENQHQTNQFIINNLNNDIAKLQEKVDKHNAEVAAKAKAEAEAIEAARLEQERLEAERLRREQERLEREAEFQIIPPFEECVKYAESLYNGNEEIEETINEKKTNYKFTCHGTVILQLICGTTDYKVSFLSNDEDMRTYLYAFEGNNVTFDKPITFKKSEYTINSLKASYTGNNDDFHYEDLQKMIDNSLQVLLDGEAIENKAIEDEKAILERRKEAEKLLREKEKQEEREQKRKEAEAKKQAELEAAEQAKAEEAEKAEAEEVKEEPVAEEAKEEQPVAEEAKEEKAEEK